MDNPLIGKTILTIQIADDKKALLFTADSGEEMVRVDGDCCSDTWIENIELPVMGFPAKVIGVENLEMPDLCGRQDGCVIAYYGCKIQTDKGDIIIDYRNESNGYYGGTLSFSNDDFYYGGVYGQNISKCIWKEIGE